MKKIIFASFEKSLPIAIFAVLLGAGNLWAAGGEGGHAEFSLGKELIRIANFAIVFGVLYYFLAGLIKGFFKKRKEDIESLLDQAKNAQAEAEKKLKELKRESASLEQEIEDLKKDAREEAEYIRSTIIKGAEEEAEKILKKAESDIKLEEKKARAALKKEATTVILQVAEEVLKKELGSDDNEKMIEDFIEKVEVSR